MFINPNFFFSGASVDNPFNSSSSNFLQASLDPAFVSFFLIHGSGTYTGSIFDVAVPSGTAPDLSGFEFMSTNPSVIRVTVLPGVVAYRPDSVDGELGFQANAAFSVQVNAPISSGVPDDGSTVFFLGGGDGGYLSGAEKCGGDRSRVAAARDVAWRSGKKTAGQAESGSTESRLTDVAGRRTEAPPTLQGKLRSEV